MADTPKLPEPDGYVAMTPEGSFIVPPQEVRAHNCYAIFTSDQMREYAALVVEQCAAVADKYAQPGGWSGRYFVGYLDAARHIAANLRGEPIPESAAAILAQGES